MHIIEETELNDRISYETKASPCEINLSDATLDLVEVFVKLSEYVSWLGSWTAPVDSYNELFIICVNYVQKW